jgi:hypothetical protein
MRFLPVNGKSDPKEAPHVRSGFARTTNTSAIAGRGIAAPSVPSEAKRKIR